MEYWLFNADRQNDYDGNEVEGVSLGDHLDYVYNHMGTPDCFDTFTGSLSAVKNYAADCGHCYIVDSDNCRVAAHINKP